MFFIFLFMIMVAIVLFVIKKEGVNLSRNSVIQIMCAAAFVGLFISLVLGSITGNYPEKWVTKKTIKLVPASKSKKGKLFLNQYQNLKKNQTYPFIIDFDNGLSRIYYFYKKNNKVKMGTVCCNSDDIKFKKTNSKKDQLIIQKITPKIEFWWVSIGIIGNRYIIETNKL